MTEVDVTLNPRPSHPLIAWIAEPRHLTVIFALAYALLTYAGFSALRMPPSSIEGELGPLMVTVWSWLWVIGGLLAVAGALPGWWYVERSGLIVLVTGALIYDATIWTLHVTSTVGNREPNALAVAVLVLMLLARLVQIWGAALDPSRGARRAPATVVDAD